MSFNPSQSVSSLGALAGNRLGAKSEGSELQVELDGAQGGNEIVFGPEGLVGA